MKQMPSVVKLLNAAPSPKASGTPQNDKGWTPLRIAVGVYRSGNFRLDAPTAKAIQELMVAAGLSTELEGQYRDQRGADK